MSWIKVLKAYGYMQLLVIAFFAAVYIRNPHERRSDTEG